MEGVVVSLWVTGDGLSAVTVPYSPAQGLSRPILSFMETQKGLRLPLESLSLESFQSLQSVTILSPSFM